MSADRPDETPAMMIANDIMAIKQTARWSDFHEIAQAAINIAIKAEREACAAICDECNRQDESDNGAAMTGAASMAAERIRARS